MTTQTAPIPTAPTQTVPTRRRFSVAEYYAMADAGIFTADDRVELLDGEIIVMAPIGDRHAGSVDRLAETFFAGLRGRAQVRVQNPVRLDNGSEPQPDIALLRRRADFYDSGHPGPADVLLLVEVSDTTIDFDRNEKLRLYARAGIPEVWIANLRDRRVESCTEPVGSEYTVVRHFEIGSCVSPQHFPELALPVDRIIPS